MVNSTGVMKISTNVRHSVTISGQVVNALTQKPISGAIVKIVSAPEEFMRRSLVKARVLTGLKPPLRLLSGQVAMNASQQFPEAIGSFRSAFMANRTGSQAKWDAFRLILDNAQVPTLDKFQCFQFVLNYCSVPSGLSRLPSERTQTAADGWFYFLDLPKGNYTLEASSGVRTSSGAPLEPISVQRNEQGDYINAIKEKVNFYHVRLPITVHPTNS